MFRRQVFNRYLSRFRGMWVRGVSRAFPTFLPSILFLLFLSRRDAGISRGTARAKRKAREETFRPSTRFRSPFRSFVRSFESRADYSIGTGFSIEIPRFCREEYYSPFHVPSLTLAFGPREHSPSRFHAAFHGSAERHAEQRDPKVDKDDRVEE